jgi:hypothetical protein
MAFPSSPTNNQTTTINNVIYTYNSTKGAWVRSTGVASFDLTANSVTLSAKVSAPQIHATANLTVPILNVSTSVLPTSNNAVNIGSSSAWFGTFYGVSSQSKYADLAENYVADAPYEPATVVVFGGEHEVTISKQTHSTAVAGVVSTNPAYLMNGTLKGDTVVSVALTGRVPCRVQGPVAKGDILVTSNMPGVAQLIDNDSFAPGCILGKALDSVDANDIKTIEIVVGKH